MPVGIHFCHAHPINKDGTKVMIGAGQSGASSESHKLNINDAQVINPSTFHAESRNHYIFDWNNQEAGFFRTADPVIDRKHPASGVLV